MALSMAMASIIGSAVSAYGNYRANRRNEQKAEDLFERDTAAVTPKPFTGGVGFSSYTPEGGTVIGLSDKYQAEADWALKDAAANKGWLSQYQQGGPAAAADVLYEQRAAPLRRQQEREHQLFEEQATARGMLQSAPTDRAAALQTEAWGNVYGDVYNKSYMDVQDIIDRYRQRISTGVNEAVNIEGIPMGYAEHAMAQGKAFRPDKALYEGAQEGYKASSAYMGEAATSLGSWIGDKKFPIGSTSAGTHKPFRPPAGGMVAGPMCNKGGYNMKASLLR